MQTVTDLTRDYIKSHVFLEEILAEGIANHSALARIMRPQFEEKLLKSVQIGSIVMALKRIESTLQKKGVQKELKADEIIVRSNLVEYTFSHTEETSAKLRLLLNSFEKNSNAFFTVTEGVFELAVIVSAKHMATVENAYKEIRQIAKRTNLSALILRLPKENVTTPGVYYSILKRLNWEGINVIDVVSTNTEFTLILNDDEVSRAFALLK